MDKNQNNMNSFISDTEDKQEENNTNENPKITVYEYIFGIDSILIGETNVNRDACFVSEEIEIGYLNDKEYIQLESSYYCDGRSSIEFYILDGSEIKPILPIKDETVKNEKIFNGLKTRFSINPDNKITIKKNGIVVDVDLDDAINSQSGDYTIDYTPINSHSITRINNKTIKVKVVLRMYDDDCIAPYVSSILIKKFGGNLLWKDN